MTTDQTYRFELTPYDTGRLLPQVSRALEKRTEILSREQYPGMWKQTDRLQALGQKQNRRKKKGLSILFLALGIFLCVPGLVNPQELWVPLLVGGLAMVRGIYGLLPKRSARKTSFDKAAEQLLAGKDALEHGFVVTFDREGMTLPTENGGTERIPYHAFSCVVETPDLFLLVFDQRVTVLQKKDLITGDISALREVFSQKTARFSA